MEGNLSMAATTLAQRPIPAPETMKDAGTPNAGAIEMFIKAHPSTATSVRLTAHCLSTEHDEEHGSEVPHKGSFLHLWD